MLRLTGAILTAALLACASKAGFVLPQIAPPPADPEAQCLRLGPVVGTADPFFGGLRSDASLIESARHDALVAAQRAGASHVTLNDEPRRWPSGMFGGGQGVTVVGVAYNCTALKPAPAVAAAPPAPAPGCTKDTECKGDRICQAGACTDPVRRTEPPGP